MDIDLTGLVLPERVEALEPYEGAKSAQFVIEPLERGFGHTLGNSVHRVLLSALRGSAVWSFRIDGVVHDTPTAAAASPLDPLASYLSFFHLNDSRSNS